MRREPEKRTGPARQAREQGLFERIAESFQGADRWLVILVWTLLFLFLALALLFAILLVSADGRDARGLTISAVGFLASLLCLLHGKAWYWQLLQKNSLRREIRRLERLIEERE